MGKRGQQLLRQWIWRFTMPADSQLTPGLQLQGERENWIERARDSNLAAVILLKGARHYKSFSLPHPPLQLSAPHSAWNAKLIPCRFALMSNMETMDNQEQPLSSQPSPTWKHTGSNFEFIVKWCCEVDFFVVFYENVWNCFRWSARSKL